MTVESERPTGRKTRWTPSWGAILLGLTIYVPLLATRPGMVGADTKTYLYLDPGRLLSRAPFMWDPNIGFGTVTHQNIGYLWPLGPYYFVMDAIGLPDWIAQRLWIGSIMMAAGLGVRWMLRELGWRSAGVTVASFAYALSPYVLEYAARISVILLPFAGLPWLIGLASRSLRVPTWRAPALFALVTLTVGGVNATSLILVMVGPLLWFAYATFVLREITFHRALAAGGRIMGLTFITSLWWITGLMIQGRYGIPILRYTETYKTVAEASLSTEIYRGLGYWFFYGQDGLGAWTQSSLAYVQNRILVLVSFLVPGLAFLSGMVTRWRTRLYFGLLIVVGLVIGVGAHPWESPTPYGSLFKTWARSDLGLSFRSTPRAAPLVVLGLAVFLGAGVAAVGRWRPGYHRVVAGGLLLLIVANMSSLFRGQFVDRNLMRDEHVPGYWTDAADFLQTNDDGTRVIEVPGIDFAAYRWGNTVDPITPGLTDRQYVARELIPYGTPASANLLNAVDGPLQAGRTDPETWAPLARLMGIGDIVLRSDLEYERYMTPRPRDTWAELLSASGLGPPVEFGPRVRNEASPDQPVDDPRNYAIPLSAGDPPPVAVFPVEEPRSILRTVTGRAPVLVAGDGVGVVSLASAAMLDPDRLLLYSGTFADDSDRLARLAATKGAALVVTDSNRRSARRWGTVRDNDGYTERAGEEALREDLGDNRLQVFPAAGDDSRTVVEQVGGAYLAASRYGNEASYTPGDRASNAMDDDLSTAWRVAAFAEAEGHYLDVELHEPVTTDRIGLVQDLGGKNRFMTAVSLSFDDGPPIRVDLDDSSRTSAGQVVTFPERRFEHLRVTVEETNLGRMGSYRGISDVGIAELRIPGVDPVHEIVRPPVDLLDTVGRASIDNDLTFLFRRRASNPADVLAADDEPELRRRVTNPVQRMFTVFGKATIAAARPDTEIDALLGLPSAAEGGVTASSSARMPGNLIGRARSAVDGDPTTAYTTPVGAPLQQLTFEYPEPVTIDSLSMLVLDTDKYSVPGQIEVTVDGRDLGSFPVASRVPGDGPLAAETGRLAFDTGPISGRSFTISITGAEERLSKDWFSGAPFVLPIAVVDIGLPAVVSPAADAPFDSGCRDDLITLDGATVPVRLLGTFGSASTGRNLRIVACGAPLRIGGATATLETSRGTVTGVDVDLLGLTSRAGGEAGPDPLSTRAVDGSVDTGSMGPSTHQRSTGRLSYQVETGPTNEPYWLVLGQSLSDGWTATTSDGVDLGPPTLVNGFANGWFIDPDVVGESLRIELRWAPQRSVWIALALSLIGVIVCLGLAVLPGRGRPQEPDDDFAIRPRYIPFGSGNRPLEPSGGSGCTVSPMQRVLATIGCLVVFAFFGGPALGIVAAIGCVAASGGPLGRWLVRIVAVLLLAAAMCFIVWQEAVHHYPLDFRWVANFEVTHAWGMAAGFLMVISMVFDALEEPDES